MFNQHKNPVETGLNGPVATALTLLPLSNCFYCSLLTTSRRSFVKNQSLGWLSVYSLLKYSDALPIESEVNFPAKGFCQRETFFSLHDEGPSLKTLNLAFRTTDSLRKLDIVQDSSLQIQTYSKNGCHLIILLYVSKLALLASL